jgi:hypothetical protein
MFVWWLYVLLLVVSLGTPGAAQRSDLSAGLNPNDLAVLEKTDLRPGRRETVIADLTVLRQSYPEIWAGLEAGKDGRVYVRLKNGRSVVYDDGRPKTFEDRLASPDLEDMLAQIYPIGTPRQAPPLDFDPGRVRVGAWFDAAYGGSPAEVKANMTPVIFAGTTVSFNGRNGAARALGRVGQQVRELLHRKRELTAYVFPLGGTLAVRNIAGTDRKSPHAWGIAIDLNPKKGAYWQWGGGPLSKNLLALQQAYPYELVKIFEDNGFIWGGRWFHYDTLHFEYRPELLRKAALSLRPGR